MWEYAWLFVPFICFSKDLLINDARIFKNIEKNIKFSSKLERNVNLINKNLERKRVVIKKLSKFFCPYLYPYDT